MKKFKRYLRDRRGTLLVNAYPAVIITAIVMAVLLTIIPPLLRKTSVDRIGNQVARYIEIQGDISAAQSEFDRLCRVKELRLDNPYIYVKADTMGGGRIQLEKEFTVYIEYDNIYEIGTFVSITKRAVSKATGRSEKYWK